jgi:hypothetical protein
LRKSGVDVDRSEIAVGGAAECDYPFCGPRCHADHERIVGKKESQPAAPHGSDEFAFLGRYCLATSERRVMLVPDECHDRKVGPQRLRHGLHLSRMTDPDFDHDEIGAARRVPQRAHDRPSRVEFDLFDDLTLTLKDMGKQTGCC